MSFRAAATRCRGSAGCLLVLAGMFEKMRGVQCVPDLVQRGTEVAGVDGSEGDDVIGGQGEVLDDDVAPPLGRAQAMTLAIDVDIPVQAHARPHSQQKVHSEPNDAPHSSQVRAWPRQ